MMKSLLYIFALFSLSLADGVNGYENTPINPLNGFRVHGSDIPHPDKVVPKSHITTPAPSDAIMLFGGKHTDAWNGSWEIKDGVMTAAISHLETKESFGDCQLHLEFRVPSGRKIKGQAGGNSGVFFMKRYEVQIQESHTNITYADGQAGALYGQYPPLVNASNPQGKWQSYDIIFEAPKYQEQKCIKPARITIIHNGVVIHHATDFSGPTLHGSVTSYPPQHPEKAPLILQWHSDPIEFRNIWIREMGKYAQKK